QTLIKMGYRLAARKAQHIIADSENTARDVHGILGVPLERISAIHLAPAECFVAEERKDDLSLLEGKYSVRPPYVMVSSARNWRKKNLETALEALSQAHRSTGVDFQTVVYGPSDGIEAVGVKNRWLHLNLRQTGHISSADLARLFRHARAFILPSLY